MIIFELAPNASYLTHLNWSRLVEDAHSWFVGQGISLWSLNMLQDSNLRFGFFDGQSVTEQHCINFLAQHDNSIQTEGQKYNAVEAGAEAQAQAIPGWVDWNEAAWLAWHLTNMETPLGLLPADIDLMTTTAFNANAKAMMGVMQDVLNAQSLAIKNIGRLDIAQRNKLWPNLEDNGN